MDNGQGGGDTVVTKMAIGGGGSGLQDAIDNGNGSGNR